MTLMVDVYLGKREGGGTNAAEYQGISEHYIFMSALMAEAALGSIRSPHGVNVTHWVSVS